MPHLPVVRQNGSPGSGIAAGSNGEPRVLPTLITSRAGSTRVAIAWYTSAGLSISMSGLTATTILVLSQGEPIASINASATKPSRG